jgi:iron complex transport system permease protein
MRRLYPQEGAGLVLIMLVVLALYAMTIGPSSISLAQIVQSILLKISSSFRGVVTANLPSWQETVLWQVRAPRVVVAALAGASLATCGAALQGLFRNPLASPDVLGFAAGAELGAAIAIFTGVSSTYSFGLSGFAILGAALTMAFVYGIAMRQGSAPMVTLLLVGVAATSLCYALMSFVLALALQQWEIGTAIVYWTLGSLEGRTWDHVLLLAPVFTVSFALIIAFHRELDILLLGEIHAVAVGVDVPRVRFWLLAATAALVGTSVAVCGGIGFIGLVVPHIVRLLIGPSHRHLLPLSALGGALALVGTDLLLRSPFLVGNPIPVGALTASLGAPYFIYLLARQRQAMNL